jgi:hypothetical protein
MPAKIILSTDELISCPNCGNKFPIEQCISRQTIKQYEDEYQTVLDNSLKQFEKQLTEQNEERLKKVKRETEQNLKKEFEEERKTLKSDIEERDLKLKEFRKNELKLLKEREKLEEEKEEFELQKERELREARKEIEEKVSKSEAQKFDLKEAEYKKKLEDALKANADLTRKLESGSQQLQGEIGELELEKMLREKFPFDDIKEVAKGERGADVLQYVCTQSGQVCGIIIWEAKRQKNWQGKWLQKVKDDCISANADIPVIVSNCMPKDCSDLFINIDGVWACRREIVRPVAETLRIMLISLNSTKLQNEGQLEKPT